MQTLGVTNLDHCIGRPAMSYMLTSLCYGDWALGRLGRFLNIYCAVIVHAVIGPLCIHLAVRIICSQTIFMIDNDNQTDSK